MAYSASNLALVYEGSAGSAKQWVYTTTDTFATVAASGYFNSAAQSTSSANGSPMTIGDVIEVRIVDAVAPTSRTSATGRYFLQVASNDGTTVTTQSAVASGSGAAVVDTTATTLSITRALHHDKEITVSSAAPIAITLPQATGTGSRFRFTVLVAATATQHTIKVANGTDVMVGSVIGILSTTALGTPGFQTTATSDTITLNGTTTGGAGGDMIEIVDVATGKFKVNMRANVVATALSLFLTPFSATVA